MIKALIKMFFGVAVLAIVLVFAGGYWIENNADVVAEAAMDASGLTEDIAARQESRCQEARRNAQDAWDRSVDSGTDEQNAAILERLDAAAEMACRKG
jgi:3-deoxy-D-arabino-heptulosonate 7-phosphate (DAHP) synthase class II